MDKHFRVEVVTCTPNPARAIWVGMHQCFDEGFALDDAKSMTEKQCSDAIVKHLLPVGHWSPFEHATITFDIGGFSHRVMQQFTRSRIGVSPSVQSFRYSGERISRLGNRVIAVTGDDDRNFWQVAPGRLDEFCEEVESLFYLRPTDHYRDRFGASIRYGMLGRTDDLLDCLYAAYRYAVKVGQGMPAEMAAGGLPMDARQAWVATFNARSLCSFFDRRTPADAQIEIRVLCDHLWPHFYTWLPGVAKWYRDNRWGKNKLSP